MERFYKPLGFAIALLIGWLLCRQPGWGLGSLAALVTLGILARVWLGETGAFFLVSFTMAMAGSDAHAGTTFRAVLLPLWAIFSGGASLACLVLRRPELGKQIDQSIGGP